MLQYSKTEINIDHDEHVKQLGFPALMEYFQDKIQIKNSQTKQYSISKALEFIDDVNDKLNDQIQLGYQQISDQSRQIKDLLIQDKISKQEQKALQLKLKREQLQMKLMYLDGQIKNKSVQQLQFIHPYVLTKEEHKAKIQKLMKEREQAAKKRKIYQQYLEKTRKAEQSKQKVKSQEEHERQRQQKRKKLQQKHKQNQQQHEKDLHQKQQRDKQYQQVKHKKRLYQQIQERYTSHVIMPSLEEKKKKLKEIRQISRGYDISSIKNHEQQYLKKRELSVNIRSKVDEYFHYKPPERSQRLAKVLQEEKILYRKQLQEKKRKIQDKLSRQQDFVAQLKERFPLKVDPKLREQIQIRNKKPEKRQLNAQNAKLQGIAYLEEAKRKRKKISELQRPETNAKSESDHQYALKPQKRHTNYLNHGNNKSNYQQIRRKKIQQIINSQQGDPNIKIKKLQIQAEKAGKEAQLKQHLSKFSKNQQIQQQTIDLLLTSIKAKIGIMDVYNKSQ